MIIHEQEIKYDPTSYIDPNGRVFEWRGSIYRSLKKPSAEFYREFLKSKSYAKLCSEGLIVETTVTDYHLPGFDLVLHHKRIPFQSYCVEWPPQMLKEAALATLNLCSELLKIDATIQDAYPWNILFDGTKPVFIDIGSIVRSESNFLWVPYQQFCNFFLHPLVLHASNLQNISRRLLFDYLRGIESKDLVRIMTLPMKLKTPDYFNKIFLPHHLGRVYTWLNLEERFNKFRTNITSKMNLSHTRLRFFKNLYKTINKIEVAPSKSSWIKYYKETESDDLKKKEQTISEVIKRLNPKSILDVGCNTGVFSVIGAQNGAEVISIDTDESCVARLYEKAKNEGLDIMPLVMDILNPTPAFGWCRKQFPPADERLKSELVLALALIHHLIFTNWQNFERIVESITSFQTKWAIYEFIEMQDKMVQIIKRDSKVSYSWYTLENFLNILNNNYSKVELLPEISKTRKLILCTK